MLKKYNVLRLAAQVIVLLLAALFFTNAVWADDPPQNLEVNVETSKGIALSGLNVYAFTESGSYTGTNATTDTNGTAIFDPEDFQDGNYKFRVDYLGYQFWSQAITLPGTSTVDVVIEEETAVVTVTTASGPAGGINVYLFTGTGSYLNQSDMTDSEGKASFELPVGRDFTFRADMLGNQYWSEVVTITGGSTNQVLVEAGGGILQVTVEKGPGIPMQEINTYLFNISDTYLGLSQVTDSSGIVEFSVPEGAYKVRADYLGIQFWSQDTTVNENTDITLTIAHQDVVITVQGIYQGTPELKEGINVYLFTPSGSYLNQYQVTDENGHVTFNLPEQAYKVRADYLGRQFWSEVFTWQDTTVNIPMADAEITVTDSGQPLEGVNVYVFSAAGSYLNLNETTNAEGQVTFRLPAGVYKFRADYQGSQYWSGEETLLADQVNPITISTGGGNFLLTVLKGETDPLIGVNCYVFNEAGSYLGMSATTNNSGQVSFALADGIYKIRVDHLGYQFWTDLYEVPATLSDDFTIAHQDVVITVEAMFQGTPEPKEGINVYLFTPSGSYLKQYQVTDENGHVTFNLPEQAYKVRADYLGRQFWSEVFTWQDSTVTIPNGLAEVHVHRSGTDVQGANVYLFTEDGSYLSWYEITDASGMAWFKTPERSYKFRADEGGDQRWSDLVQINADQVTIVDLNLSDQPTVTISADPETIQVGESSTLAWTSTNADSVSIDQGIGSVDLSGTTAVSPTETTTYTISATGPGGTATDSATVTISSTMPIEIKLTASDAAERDYFGSSVAISGDYAIVGVPGDDDGGDYSGSAYIFKRQGSDWVEQTKITASDADAGDSFGSSVSIEGEYAIVGAEGKNWDSGAAYVFKREGSTWIEQAKLTASNATEWYFFGRSVAISGDYIIVGASKDPSEWGERPGEAYIFKREGSAWTEHAILSASDGTDGDFFGHTVSINVDYAIVGAYESNDGAGSAYVFKREGSIWTEQAKITPSDAADNDGYGYFVAIGGEYAIVGSPWDDDAGSASGSAYIFKREGSTWNEQAKLTASDGASYDLFGGSVSISGDYVIVGARTEVEFGSGPGAAYIFKREGSTWTEQHKLTASDGAEYDYFGGSVSISSGYAIVGALFDDDAGSASGSAYIYSHEDFIQAPTVTISADPESILIGESSTLTWTSTNADSASIDQGIGSVDVTGSISISPNSITTYTITVTGPGGTATDSVIINVIDSDVPPTVTISADPATILVGESSTLTWSSTNAASVTIDNGIGDVPVNGSITVSPTETTTYTITATGPAGTATDSATVTVIYPPTVTISADPSTILVGQSSTLTWSSTNADSVSIDQGIGSVDLSGTTMVSPSETTTYTITATGPGGTATDSVTVIVSSIMLIEIKLTASDAAAYDRFAEAVSISGDYAIVGALGSDNYTGSAYIFKREDSTWTEQAKLTASDAAEYDSFHYVSIDGDYAIVGAPGNDDAGSYSGSAYIFKREGSTWTEQAKLTASDADAGDHFGSPVSIDGDYAIVGASRNDDAGSASGSAYIFKREGSTWTEQAKLTASDGASYYFFGRSVSIDGDYAIVGAYGSDNYTGAAYIFKREGSTWTEQAKLTASDAAEYDYFGWSVAVDGNYAIVGAPGDPEAGEYPGSSYVFKREGATWTEQAKLTASDAAEYDYFGGSVSISGDYVIVGARAHEEFGSGPGAAHIFKREGSIWTEQYKLTASDRAEHDYFGHSVSISGDYAIVGAPFDDDAGNISGSAYIYSILTVGISANPETIQVGETSTLTWTSTNADSASINQGIGDVPVNGSISVSPNETTTYTITVNGPGGTVTDSVTVTVTYPPPTVTISADPESILIGESSTLTWTSTNADSCVIEPGIGSVDVNGSITVSPTETTTYTITATGPGGTTTDSVAINVIDPDVPPTVNISAAPETIVQGSSSTLTWTTTNAASVTIDNGIGDVPVNGSITVSPTETTTYTITATGPAGTATDSVTVTVTYPPPTVSISADPETILVGESSTLTWSSTNADSASINQGIGDVPVNGSISVSPDETTTYTIMVNGPGGTAMDSVTVTVTYPPPTVSISADPSTIQVGETSTLIWSSTNADSASIDQGIGSVDLSGTIIVSPSETTTYTITATGPGGTATDSVVVCIASPEGTDYGLYTNEQQGGGGLVGETIRILNGNGVEYRSDLRFSSPNRLGLPFQAFYNSRSADLGSLGYGWTHTYGVSLDPSFEMGGKTYVKTIDQTGRAYYFLEEGTGVYMGVFKERSHVKAEGGGYVWYRLDGTRYGFASSGRLLRIDDEKGNRLDLTYDANNRVETVTDNASGRVLTFNYNADNRLESISGPTTTAVPSGIWVTYDYDDNQNLTSVTYADDSGFAYTYNDTEDVHNLTEKRDKEGHLLNTWAYNSQDQAISNFSVNGKGVSISYVSESQVNVTDAYGTLRSYTLGMVDGRKRVTAMTGIGSAPYSVSNAIRWVYDEDMRLTEVEYAGGTINQYQNYDTKGNPGTIILAYNTPEERTITYTCHPNMNAPLTRIETSVLGSGTKETIWDYDNNYDTIPNEDPTGLVSRIIEKGFTKDAFNAIVSYEYITAFTYTSKGQVLSIDGPIPGSGDTTSFTYDPTTGDLLTITRPLIGATSFSNYDAAGQVGLVTDVNNQSKGFTYDGRGRVTLIINNADGSTNSVIYNTAGFPDSRTDEDGVIKSFLYDTLYGRLARTTDHVGNYISYDYDLQGNMIEKSYYDPLDVRTNRKRYLYQDPAHNMPGKLYKEINPDDTFTKYGYDLEGNVASITDPNNNTTSYEYDPLNRLITVTQPGTVVTSYTYDGHGNLQTVTDAESHTTTHEYDDMGRLLSTTSPDTGTVTYVYDEAGNPVNKTDAKGITVGYGYDLLNRLTDLNFPDSTQDITYTYDTGANGMGRRTGMIDPSGSMTFGYDVRGRLVEKTSIINSQSYTVSQSFTPGSRTSSLTYPTGRTIDYVRTTCACNIDGIYTTYVANTVTLMENLSYRPFGGAKGMNTGAGDTVDNVHDQSGRLIVSNQGQPKERIYDYDANGKLESLTVTKEPWKSRTYEYDALNRLTKADGVYGVFKYRYYYDRVGNRLQKTTRSTTETYMYFPGTNKLEQITGSNPVGFAYDANGNITGIGTKTLIYNQNNRLIRVEENGDILGEYIYNGIGQRVIKAANGVTTVFHYDFEGNIIGESQPDGSFTREYLYRSTNRLAMVDVSTQDVYFFLNDNLGTPLAVIDLDNNAVWEATYKPFGEAKVHPLSTVVNNFRFAGQYFDQETGLHYNYHRYYDPRTGRYLRPDPVALIGGINLFVYCLNDPVNLIDPFGFASVWVELTGEALLGAGGIIVTYGLITGNPVVVGAGFGVGIIGGILKIYDVVTSAEENIEKTQKQFVKPLHEQMQRTEDLREELGLEKQPDPCP